LDFKKPNQLYLIAGDIIINFTTNYSQDLFF